jgi:hypothetical protein
MITIENIDKILSINSQKVNVMGFDYEHDFYEFIFEHDNIHSTTFKVHMNRYSNKGDNNSYKMKLWDDINSTPLEYNFELYNVNDPFCLLAYLNDVIHDWDIITNK